MEAMQPGGKLRVLARSDDEFVYLQFIDTGSGISEDELSRILQPYYTTKKEGPRARHDDRAADHPRPRRAARYRVP